MKTCCTCKIEKSLDLFYRWYKSKDGRTLQCKACQRLYYISKRKLKGNYVHPVPKNRKCTYCKKIFLNNKENFFTKKNTWNRKDGSIGFKIVTRSTCKTCHTIISTKRTRKKRYKFYNCTEKNYEKTYRKARIETKSTLKKEYPYAFRKDLTKIQSLWIIKQIRAGYKWISYKQWIIDRQILRSNSRRRNFGNYHDDLPKEYLAWKFVPKSLKKIIFSKRRLTDGIIANRMGMKLENASISMLSARRLTSEIINHIKVNN